MHRKLSRIAAIIMASIHILLFSACSQAEITGKYTLTVLQTNDLHGNFSNMPQYATLVKKVRSEEDNVLLLDAGDVFKRGAYESYYGEIEMEIENAMGYDAFVLGNNEFKVPGSVNSTQESGTLAESDAQIANIIKWADFPILCGNVTLTKTGEYISGTKPYVILNVGSLKIGIIGVTSTAPKDSGLDMTSDKAFEVPENAVTRLVAEIGDKADIIIVLSHAGMDSNRCMTGVAAIISGHDHIKTVKPDDATGIPIMQAGGEEDNYLGRLDLTFERKDGKWVLTDYTGKLYSAEEADPDSDIQKIIDKYEAEPIPTFKAA